MSQKWLNVLRPWSRRARRSDPHLSRHQPPAGSTRRFASLIAVKCIPTTHTPLCSNHPPLRQICCSISPSLSSSLSPPGLETNLIIRWLVGNLIFWEPRTSQVKRAGDFLQREMFLCSSPGIKRWNWKQKVRIGEVGGGITAGRFGVRISPPAFLVQFARSACACVGVLYSRGPKVCLLGVSISLNLPWVWGASRTMTASNPGNPRVGKNR